jgi:hypothetical protein
LGLGRLLLCNAEDFLERHASGQAEDSASASAGSSGSGPDAVVLFPALGFPAIVGNMRQMFCLLLAKSSFTADPASLQNLLKYQPWPSSSDAIPDASSLNSFGNDRIYSVDSRPVSEVIDARGVCSLPGIGGQGRLSPEVLSAYRDRGYDTLVWFLINLPSGVEGNSTKPPMYNLVIPGEDVVLRELISAIPLPHDDCPRGNDTKTSQNHDVRPLHPFCVHQRDYLNVAHMTDLHVAWRWELMQQRIQADHSAMLPHFNNLNTRFKEHLAQIRDEDNVHMAMLTGDLVDYNRGHDGGSANDLDANYAFNRNWVLFYEILMDHYDRPLFTALGNHDWRLNPYAPVPRFVAPIWREQPNPWLVIIPFLLIAGAGTGVFTGLSYASFAKDETAWTWAGVGFTLLAIQWTPSMIAAMLAIVEEWAGAASTGFLTTWWLWLAFYGLSLVFWGLTAASLYGVLEHGTGVWYTSDKKDDLGDGAAEGTLWGSVCGGSFGVLLALALSIALECGALQMNEVPPYTFLTQEETEQVISEDFHRTNMVGKNSTLLTTELAFRWYSLVINPFMDYSFRAGNNMSCIMLDWNRGEDIIHSSPPAASWAFSEDQWQLVRRWSDGVSPTTAMLLGMHATVFSPDSDVDLGALASTGEDWDSGDLDRACIRNYRGALVSLLRDIKSRSAAVVALSGHTHINDVFQFEGSGTIVKHDQVTTTPSTTTSVLTMNSNEPFFLTTTCANPLGTGDDGKRPKEERRPARREIMFDANGQVDDLVLRKLTPPPDLRDNVL